MADVGVPVPINDEGRDGVVRAVEYMENLEASPRGWSWHAEAVIEAPGWFRVWQQGAGPFDILIGGRTFLGPGDTVVQLSSNPFIHGFAQTSAVLAEVGDRRLSSDELAAEIERRTAEVRRA